MKASRHGAARFRQCMMRRATVLAALFLSQAMLAGCASTPPPEAPQLAANCEQVPENRAIEVGGVRLRYVEQGVGKPAVVLLHGNGAMVEDFALSGALAVSAARHHRTVAFDRPGYGDSERPRDRAWTPAEQAALLAKAFARLGIERPIVVGHSWGTLVALALALDHSDAVSGLVLVAGYYYPTGRADLALSTPFAAPVLGDVLRYTVLPVTGPFVAPGLVRQMFAPVPVPACFSAHFPLDRTLRPRPERASAEEAAMLDGAVAALAHRYHELRVPVAIMVGDGDRLVDPARHSVRLHGELPGSSLVVVPGQGHMVHHGVPDLVADAVEAVAAPRRR